MRKLSHLLKGLATAALVFGQTFIATAKDDVTWVYWDKAEPLNWKDEAGVARGVEVEIVDYVMQKLGIKVNHTFYPWKRAQQLVESGEADAMMTTPTAGRFAYAVFGKEIALPEYWTIFVKKDNTKVIEAVKGFKTLDDLKPYKLVDFIGNGWMEAFLKKPGGYDIYEVPKLEQIPSMIAAGRYDLAINSSSWINYWAEKAKLQDQLVELDNELPNTRFHFVMMVSRKSPWAEKGLVRAMDEQLVEMKKDSTWLDVLKKYKNPHGSGKPFTSQLDAAYLEKNGFYKDYDSYPIFKKP